MANSYSYKKRFLNINSEWQKEARKKRPLKMDERAQDAFNEARQILFNKDDEYEQIKIEYFKIENKLKEAKKKNSKKIFNAAKKELEELSLKYKTLLDKGLERDLGYGDVVLLDEYLRAMTPDAVKLRKIGNKHENLSKGGQVSKKTQLEGVLLAIAEVKEAKPELTNKRAAVWNYLKKLTREGKPQTIDGKYLISISGDYLKQETIHGEKKTIRKIKRSSFIKHYF